MNILRTREVVRLPRKCLKFACREGKAKSLHVLILISDNILFTPLRYSPSTQPSVCFLSLQPWNIQLKIETNHNQWFETHLSQVIFFINFYLPNNATMILRNERCRFNRVRFSQDDLLGIILIAVCHNARARKACILFFWTVLLAVLVTRTFFCTRQVAISFSKAVVFMCRY